MPPSIYMDNAATTPVDRRVLDAMLPFLTESFGNASSIHRLGQDARNAVDEARAEVANLINAAPNEIVFTSGGTESNNLAIRGLLEERADSRGHIVISSIEHPAVKEVCTDLGSRGFEVTSIGCRPDGTVSAEEVKDAIRDDTLLVSLMLANNELGTLQPVSEIGRFVSNLQAIGRKIFLHTDAVQAVGKIPVDVEELHCDLLSLSAHKMYAPKGAGALFVKKGTRLHKQNIGGSQERKMRGGTENVAGIVALGAACKMAAGELAAEAQTTRALRETFEKGVEESIPSVKVNGIGADRLPNISNIIFEGVDGEAVLINLDMKGVAVSTGSACSSGTIEASPVVSALGFDERTARGAVRFSFGRMNSMKDVEAVLALLPPIIENLRRLA